MYRLEQQPQMYFIYSSSLELAVKRFEANVVFVLLYYVFGNFK